VNHRPDNRRSQPDWGALGALLRLAAQNVLRQRSRSATALIAIALGVASLIVAGGFIHDVYIQMGESIIHSQYGHLQIYRRGYVQHGTQHPTDYLIDDPDAVIQRIQALPGVAIVLPRLHFTGLANAGGGDWAIVGEGIEPNLENQLGTYVQLVSGRLLREDDSDAVIVGDGVANALRLSSGQPITLSISTRAGALNSVDFQVVGIFRSYSKEFDQRSIRMPLKAARDLLATSAVNEIAVALTETAATDATASLANASIGELGYEVRSWRDLADFYNKTVHLLEREFAFLEGVMLLMIVLSVANTINTAAFERLPEFGTMLALGDRRRDVFRLIMLECTILGMLGSLLGVGIGIALALALSALGIPMPPPPNTDLGYTALIRIVPGVIFGAVAVGVAAAILAGVFPSLRIARTGAAEALRRAM
jgi:putative ABC transport system permease protein